MSKVEIEIPDDRWFRGEWDFRPQDKQLCVVILNQGSKIPKIFQYREDMKKTGNVSGVVNLCQLIAHAFAQIAGSKIKGKTNAAEVAYRALSVRCMVSVIGAGKTQ